MAKVCHSCGKGPAFGNSRSHSLVATRRRFNPNLQKVRAIVESTTYRLLEAIAAATRHELLADFDVDEVCVRVRKPAVQLGGPLDYAGVEIRRRRGAKDRRG